MIRRVLIAAILAGTAGTAEARIEGPWRTWALVTVPKECFEEHRKDKRYSNRTEFPDWLLKRNCACYGRELASMLNPSDISNFAYSNKAEWEQLSPKFARLGERARLKCGWHRVRRK